MAGRTITDRYAKKKIEVKNASFHLGRADCELVVIRQSYRRLNMSFENGSTTEEKVITHSVPADTNSNYSIKKKSVKLE